MLTESPFIGPYRALAAPAAHAYYFFIILSALRLRPLLSFLTGLASALGLAALTAYTVPHLPGGPRRRQLGVFAPDQRDLLLSSS